MRVAVTQDAAVRWAQGRQRQAVRRRPGGHPQRPYWRFEQVGESRIEAATPFVAVVGGIEPVGGGDRVEHRRVGGGRIVGEKTHEGWLPSGSGLAWQAKGDILAANSKEDA
jgi:hypothetical protein